METYIFTQRNMERIVFLNNMKMILALRNLITALRHLYFTIVHAMRILNTKSLKDRY